MEETQKQILICLDKWMTLRERKITITDYCKHKNAYKIAIYGYGKIGRHLLYELQQNGFLVAWIMDQRAENIKLNAENIKILAPDGFDTLPEADMVIVTVLDDFRSIEAFLCKYTEMPVVPFYELFDRVWEKNKIW